MGLDRGRRGSAADRVSDHRRLEQQQQYGEQWLVTDGNDKQHAHSAGHDRLRLNLTEAGDAGGPDGSGPVAGRREIKELIGDNRSGAGMGAGAAVCGSARQ